MVIIVCCYIVQKSHGTRTRMILYCLSPCSAGVGRSGTVMAIDFCLQQIEKEKVGNVRGFVSKMRDQRNYMVQTEVCSSSKWTSLCDGPATYLFTDFLPPHSHPLSLRHPPSLLTHPLIFRHPPSLLTPHSSPHLPSPSLTPRSHPLFLRHPPSLLSPHSSPLPPSPSLTPRSHPLTLCHPPSLLTLIPSPSITLHHPPSPSLTPHSIPSPSVTLPHSSLHPLTFCRPPSLLTPSPHPLSPSLSLSPTPLATIHIHPLCPSGGHCIWRHIFPPI